jgi:F420-0:gamma-glutamyl ligase-like protein
MVFIETPIFTVDVRALLSDDEYTVLQHHLVTMPNAGDVIAGTGVCGRFGGRLREGESVAALG